MTEDTKLCEFLRNRRPQAEEAGLRDLGEVKVLDLVEGEEVELPEKGESSDTEQCIERLCGDVHQIYPMS